MANLKDWIRKMAGDEPILGVVIGGMGWGSEYGSEDIPNYDKQPRNKLLLWDTAAPFLDYEFYDGYGSPGCNAVVAWTENWVITVGQYDGSTWPYRIARNPIAHEPKMEGG